MLPVLSLQNLLQYNSTLFDNIVVPSGSDRQLLIDTIVSHYGDMQPISPDWPVLRYYIDSWFKAHLQQLSHLWNDYIATYNPIYNKDGYVEEKRSPNLVHSEEREDTQHGTGTAADSGSTTQQYRGFQASAMNDVVKTVPATSTTTNTSADASGKTVRTETGREDVFRHEYGNIGVTMASQMLRDDLSFWQTYSFYDVAAKLWAVDNLVMIY